jgi:hypothetical protein
MDELEPLPPSAHRLVRETPWSSNLGCGLIAALITGAVGGVTLFMEHLHPTETENAWVIPTIGWVFVGVALLIVYSSIHQKFAVRSPETIIAVEADEFRPGTSVRVHILQPGPLRMQSLRVNLWGLSVTTTPNKTSTRDLTTTKNEYLGTFNFFEQKDFDIPAGKVFHGVGEMQIPAGAPPSGKSGTLHGPEGWRNVTWRIEVWGKVRRAADFEHPFVIEVK